MILTPEDAECTDNNRADLDGSGLQLPHLWRVSILAWKSLVSSLKELKVSQSGFCKRMMLEFRTVQSNYMDSKHFG